MHVHRRLHFSAGSGPPLTVNIVTVFGGCGFESAAPLHSDVRHFDTGGAKNAVCTIDVASDTFLSICL
jgi:hypothetical protein